MAARQLRTAAVAAKYQLLPPPTVTTCPAAADSTVVKLLSASRGSHCSGEGGVADLAFSLSELSCRGCRPQLHILVLSRNPFSRLGCHRHIKSPNSGPHWAIMGIVVFLGLFWAFWDPRAQQGAIFCCAVTCCRMSHMLEERRSDRDCGLPCAVKPRRSPLTCSFVRRTAAATTLAASQMHLLSLSEKYS